MATIKNVQVEAKLIEKFRIEGNMRHHTVYVDQPEAGGGDNSAPTPLEYTLLSLAACVITISQIVAKQQRIQLRHIDVKVEADIDAEVFMGKGQDNRVGFRGIKVITEIDADMSLEEKKAFLETVDQRCPVSDNLKALTPVAYEIKE